MWHNKAAYLANFWQLANERISRVVVYGLTPALAAVDVGSGRRVRFAMESAVTAVPTCVVRRGDPRDVAGFLWVGPMLAGPRAKGITSQLP
jgi:hypothetical protein